MDTHLHSDVCGADWSGLEWWQYGMVWYGCATSGVMCVLCISGRCDGMAWYEEVKRRQKEEGVTIKRYDTITEELYGGRIGGT